MCSKGGGRRFHGVDIISAAAFQRVCVQTTRRPAQKTSAKTSQCARTQEAPVFALLPPRTLPIHVQCCV